VRPILVAARRTIRTTAPHAEEILCKMARPRSPSMMWKLARYAVDGEVVVTLGTFTQHASMFFAHGSEIEDEADLLEGNGKLLRYITLRRPEDAKRPPTREIVRRAFLRVPTDVAGRSSTT
jgi:hypothetical protein